MSLSLICFSSPRIPRGIEDINAHIRSRGLEVSNRFEALMDLNDEAFNSSTSHLISPASPIVSSISGASDLSDLGSSVEDPYSSNYISYGSADQFSQNDLDYYNEIYAGIDSGEYIQETVSVIKESVVAVLQESSIPNPNIMSNQIPSSTPLPTNVGGDVPIIDSSDWSSFEVFFSNIIDGFDDPFVAFGRVFIVIMVLLGKVVQDRSLQQAMIKQRLEQGGKAPSFLVDDGHWSVYVIYSTLFGGLMVTSLFLPANYFPWAVLGMQIPVSDVFTMGITAEWNDLNNIKVHPKKTVIWSLSRMLATATAMVVDGIFKTDVFDRKSQDTINSSKEDDEDLDL